MPAPLRIRALRLLEVGALALAVGQLLLLALKATLLVESLGAGALGLFAGTEHAAAGITRAALALALAAAAREPRPRARPPSRLDGGGRARRCCSPSPRRGSPMPTAASSIARCSWR